MVQHIADIRPEERRSATAAFLTLFGTLAGHTLLETARDALFLARLPADQLPWTYLAIAVLAVLISQGPARPEGRAAQRFGLALVLLGAAAVTAAFWLLGSWSNPWTLRALYVWTGIVGTLTGLQFWLAMGDLYTVTQAKRLYKVIGVGGLLGAATGAAAAREIATRFGAPQLVLVSACVLALAGLGPALWLRRPVNSRSQSSPPVAEAIALLRSQPYLRHLAGLVFVSTVTMTLADYIFKSTVAANVKAEDLASYFAGVYAVFGVLALLAQTLLVGWLLRTLGLHRSMWVLPALALIGAGGVAAGGGLAAALFLKGADGTFRHSLNRTSTELLFVPLADGLRRRVKPFIDVVGQRGGQAIASLFILAELGVRHGETTVMAVVIAGLCLLWVVIVSELRVHYLDLFRTALREGTIRDTRELPEIDLNSLEALFAALSSSDDAEVIGAMEFLGEQDRTPLIPALILYHPSQPVVLRAFELFEKSGRKDVLPIADRLVDHDDPEIRAAALRVGSSLEPRPERLRAALQDASAVVRSTALVGLVAGSGVPAGSGDEAGPGTAEMLRAWIERCVAGEQRGESLSDIVRAGDADDGCTALARAVRRQPSAAFEDALLQMADSSNATLQTEVAFAMAAVRSERLLPALLPMLASHAVRAAARSALVSYGLAGLRFLDEAMSDQKLPRELRRHLPRTIALFPPQEAAERLQARLLTEPDGMVRFKVIRALGRLATDNREIRLDATLLREATGQSLSAVFRLAHWQKILSEGAGAQPARATRGHDLLVTLLKDKQEQVIERVFRLLDLMLRDENLKQIHRGLRSTQPKVRANSRELLENLLRPPLRDAVVALVDETPFSANLSAGVEYYVPDALDYERLLADLIEQPNETIRSIAAFHIGELGLVGLRERLIALDPADTGFFVARVVERALGLLSHAEGEASHAH